MSTKTTLPRRQCLKILGTCGLGSLVPSLYLKAAYGQEHLQKTSKTMSMMGTLVTLTIYDPSKEKAVQLQEEAFQKMAELIPIFDRYNPQSHISWLNCHGVLNDVPPNLAKVLQTSQALYQKTQKAFDISMLPLLELYKKTLATTGRTPSHAQVKKQMEVVGFEKIAISSRKVVFQNSGMRISLDGIAKGFIVDQAVEFLKFHGVHYALINAGGDIRAIQGKGNAPWIIGIEDPRGKKRSVQKIGLKDMAVATSGHYENYFDSSGRHHHIIDASQGDSPRRTLSATVIAPSAMLADGLSTAAFVLPPEKSSHIAQLFSNVATKVIVHGGRSFNSLGWNRFVVS